MTDEERGVVLDLFSGTGSATQPFVDCGKHRVIRIDIAGKPDVRADVRKLPIRAGVAIEYAHESAPCVEFSPLTAISVAKGQRGPRDPAKGVRLAREAHEQLMRLSPRFWTAENVRASEKWLTPVYGRVLMRRNAWVFWGNVPLGLIDRSNRIFKSRKTAPRYRPLKWIDRQKNRRRVSGGTWTVHNPEAMTRAERAMIPRPLAEAVHAAVCGGGK